MMDIKAMKNLQDLEESRTLRTENYTENSELDLGN